VVPVWASEAIDLITELASAADLVTALATEAEESLARVAKAMVRHLSPQAGRRPARRT